MSTRTAPTASEQPRESMLRAVPAGADRAAVAAAEERRWLTLLGIPFALSAAFFAAAVGSGWEWLLGPALVVGPMLIIIGFIYLGLTSDSNGDTAGSDADAGRDLERLSRDASASSSPTAFGTAAEHAATRGRRHV